MFLWLFYGFPLFSANPAQAQNTGPFKSGDDLLIYAFAENHTLAPDGTLSVASTLHHLPKVTLAPDGFNLLVTFTPRKPELIYTVQHSTDLKVWTNVPTPITQLDTPHTLTTGLAIPADPVRLFARVKVTLADPLAIDLDADGLPDIWEKHCFTTIMTHNAATPIPLLDNLTALDACLNDLDPTRSLAEQSAETYTYDAKARLLSRQTPVSATTQAYDAEGNIETSAASATTTPNP